jgi:hypothetical protein
MAMAFSAQAQDADALIADALLAAPPSIQGTATVKDWEGNILREGTNEYTCYPTPPQLEGTAPMCLDEPWSVWAGAWMSEGEFEINTVGVAYMLAGDEGASNIDPYAEGPTDDNEWVVEGPHLMIILPDASALDGLPTDPENGGPYVMWKGTPYAHIMVPVAE